MHWHSRDLIGARVGFFEEAARFKLFDSAPVAVGKRKSLAHAAA